MTTQTKDDLEKLFNADAPSNYESADDAIESIADEFDVDNAEHAEICDAIEQWFAKGD
jgi:hypothetical protein